MGDNAEQQLHRFSPEPDSRDLRGREVARSTRVELLALGDRNSDIARSYAVLRGTKCQRLIIKIPKNKTPFRAFASKTINTPVAHYIELPRNLGLGASSLSSSKRRTRN